MRTILAASLLGIGCGGGGEAKLERLPNNRSNVAENVERAKARVALIKKDSKAIADKAVERMRHMAIEHFGRKAGDTAVITADASNVKVVGDDIWKVTGQYAGLDEDGREFVAPFTATLQILMYSLYASGIELSERTYKK